MINQPQEETKLPANVKAKVQRVKEQLAVEEQEVIVLKGAKFSLNKEINQMVKDREGLVNEIAESIKVKAEIQQEIKDLQEELQSSLDKLEESAKKLKENEDTIRGDYKIFEEADAKLKKQIAGFDLQYKLFKGEVKQFQEDRDKFAKREDKLRKALDV